MPQATTLAGGRRAVRLTAMFSLHVNGLVSSSKQDPRPFVPVINCGCRRLAHRSRCLLNETRGPGIPDDGFVFLCSFSLAHRCIFVATMSLLCCVAVVMSLSILTSHDHSYSYNTNVRVLAVFTFSLSRAHVYRRKSHRRGHCCNISASRSLLVSAPDFQC